MRDLLFLALVAGFFALAAAYVRGCAAMVGQHGLGRPDVQEPESDVDSRAAS